MQDTVNTSRDFLRHALATLAYRGGKAVRGAPAQFAGFRAGATSRSPAHLLAHIGDLMDWALSILKGAQVWKDSAPLPWDEEVARFHASLAALDSFLAAGRDFSVPLEKIFQGPIADALTHVGQLTMLRRLSGDPVRGENYYVADITTGRLGPDQPPARREFD